MKKQLRFLTTLLFLMVVSVGWAETYTWTTASGQLTPTTTEVTINGVTWNFIPTWVDNSKKYVQYSGGQVSAYQIGSSNNKLSSLILSTSGINGTITKISVIWSSCAANNASLNVTVGGENFGQTASSNSSTLITSTFEGSKSGEIALNFTATTGIKFQKIVVEYGSADTRTPVTLTFPQTTYEKMVGETFTVTATADPVVSPIKYESSDETVATVVESTGEVTALKKGTATITAKFEETTEYKPAQTSYTLSVVNNPNAPGQVNNPYTVADAITFIETLGTSSSEMVYVEGKISRIVSTSVLSDGGISYNISDDGEDTNTIRVNNGKNLGNESFTSLDQISVGDEVKVYGTLKKSNSNPIYNFNKGNYLVYLKHRPNAPTFSPAAGPVTAGTEVTITAPEGCTLSYTVNGTAKTSTGRTATETINSETTIVAKSVDEDDNESESVEVTAVYSITNKTEGTILFGSNDGYVPINRASVQGDDNLGNTWTVTTTGTTSYTQHGDFYQVGKRDEPATSITFTMTLPNDQAILSIEGKFGGYGGTQGDITIKLGDTTVGTGSLNEGNEVVVSAKPNKVGKTITIVIDNISRGVNVYYIKYSYGAVGNKYMTYCSTQNLDFTDKDLKAYKAVGYDHNKGTVQIHRLYEIPAGTGILIKASDDILPAAFSAADYITNNNVAGVGLNMFVGVTSAVTVQTTGTNDQGENCKTFILAKKNGNIGFYPLASAGPIGANKAYLQIPTAALNTSGDAVSFEFVDEEETDAIQGVETKTVDNDAWYTIQGVRVAQPTQSGIYIHNGVKVVVK